MQAQGQTPDGAPEREPAPDILEAFRQVGEGSKASLAATLASARALRALVVADIALARSALGRSVAFTAVAVVLGAVGGLLLTSALVAALVTYLKLSWWLSLLLVGLLCLAATAVSAWRALTYFEHTQMRATRRQLAKMGLGELQTTQTTAHDEHS
ncbi:MAG: phage holin family protein [Pseudomonadota bacterium]|nr:phage holin family protein [Pseudomonadota bacterium]